MIKENKKNKMSVLKMNVKMFICFEIVQRKFKSRLKELDLSRNASRFLVEVLNSSLLC